jgi:hypothetical protein
VAPAKPRSSSSAKAKTGEDTLEAKPKPRPFEEAKAEGSAGPVTLHPDTREPVYGGDMEAELAAGAPLNSFALEAPASSSSDDSPGAEPDE